jgi:CRISPR-associated protein Csm4
MLFLVKLRFKKSVAFGNFSLFDEDLPWGTIHSDTLFSALLNQWAKIPGAYEVDRLIHDFHSGPPPFLISSAFPFGSDTYFLPTPRGTSDLYADSLKDFPYLDLDSFLKLARGEKDQLREIVGDIPAAGLVYLDAVQRVTIDRVTNATNLFQTDTWTMFPGSGLYFLLDSRDDSHLDTLKIGLRMLGEAGIGADRSIGYGTFDWGIHPISDVSEWSELFEVGAAEGLTYCSLSLCCPEFDKITKQYPGALEAISYRIISRSGWISSSSSWGQSKRRACKMFAEGSLFRSPIGGCIANVTPSGFEEKYGHEVFRYGLAFMVAGDWCDGTG